MEVCLYFIFIFSFLVPVDGIVETDPSIFLQGGREGRLPCRVQREPLSIAWYKAASDADSIPLELVLLDLQHNKRIEVGLEDSFNITEDFSLVINEVQIQDEGQYICEVFDSLTQQFFKNQTDLYVYVLPEQPYPTLDLCLTNELQTKSGKNCSLYNITHFNNITCFVNGYYPAIKLYFQLDSKKIQPIKNSTWKNTDSTVGESVTILAIPDFYSYECIAHVMGQSSTHAASILIRQRPLLSSGENTLSKDAAVGIVAVLFFTSIIIPGILFACIWRRRNEVVQVDLDVRHLNVKNELHWFYFMDTFTLPKLLGITVKAFHIDGTEARRAARLIFQKQKIETLGLRYEGAFSEVFSREMERSSVYSGINSIVHIGGKLDSAASGCYARALSHMPHLRVMYHRETELGEDFYREMAEMASCSKVRYMSHWHKHISSSSVYFLGRALSNMTNLNVLHLEDIPLDDGFFKILEETASDIKVGTIIMSNRSLSVGREASRHFARSVFKMRSLRTLRIGFSSLDDIFYELMAAKASTLWIETLCIWQLEGMSASALNNFTTLPFLLRNLVTLIHTVYWGISQPSTFSSMCRDTKIKKLSVQSGYYLTDEASRHLADGISSMPELTSLILAYNGRRVVEYICAAVRENLKSLQISALVLRALTLTRKNVQDLLSLRTLKCVKFISISHERREISGSQEEGQSSVEDISMDDESLPHLLELGLHTQCLQIKKLQIEFTRDVKNEDIVSIQKFHDPSHVFLAAYRSFSNSDGMVPVVHFKDPSVLLGSSVSSWTRLQTLALVDILLGERETHNILHAAKLHETLCNLIMIRCGATCTLDLECEQLMSDGFVIRLVHGLPRTKDNYTDDHYVSDTTRLRREHYEGGFRVIRDEFDSYI